MSTPRCSTLFATPAFCAAARASTTPCSACWSPPSAESAWASCCSVTRGSSCSSPALWHHLHAVRVPRPRGVASPGVRVSGSANDRAGRAIANLVVGHQLFVVDDQAHAVTTRTRTCSAKTPTSSATSSRSSRMTLRRPAGLSAWLTRRQGYLFFPMLVLEGLNLHLHGFRTVFGKGKVDKRWLEITMLTPAHRPVCRRDLPDAAARNGRSRSSACSSPCSASTWVRRSPRTTRGCRSSPGRQGGLPASPGAHVAQHPRRLAGSTSSWAASTTRSSTTCSRTCRARTSATHRASRRRTAPSTPSPTPRPRSRSRTASSMRYLNRVGLAAGGDPFDCPAAQAFGR